MALLARRMLLLLALIGLYAAHPILGVIGLAAGFSYGISHVFGRDVSVTH